MTNSDFVNTLYCLKLYHKYSYGYYNIYDYQGNLLAYLEDDFFSNNHLDVFQTISISQLRLNINLDLSKYKYVKVLDPKIPTTLDDRQAENFTIVIAKNIYMSLGSKTSIFKSPDSLQNEIINLINENNISILNIGSGSSTFNKLKSKMNNTIINLDLFYTSEIDKISNYVIGDIYAPPFKENSFDILISQFLLEHLSNLKKAFHNMATLLKINGKLIVSYPFVHIDNNDDIPINPIFYHLRSFSYKRNNNSNWMISLDEVTEQFNNYGMKKVSSKIYDQNNNYIDISKIPLPTNEQYYINEIYTKEK